MDCQPVAFVVHILKRYVKAGDILLDVGCGPSLYRSCTPATYIGLDKDINAYVTERKHPPDIIGCARHLPIRDATVDVVMSKSAFFHFPAPFDTLVEFRRVLKDGGRLLLFDYNRRTQKRLERAENSKRPCWTQWALKKLVEQAGFRQTTLLLPITRSIPRPLSDVLLVYQELTGTWAIVTGVK